MKESLFSALLKDCEDNHKASILVVCLTPESSAELKKQLLRKYFNVRSDRAHEFTAVMGSSEIKVRLCSDNSNVDKFCGLKPTHIHFDEGMNDMPYGMVMKLLDKIKANES